MIEELCERGAINVPVVEEVNLLEECFDMRLILLEKPFGVGENLDLLLYDRDELENSGFRNGMCGVGLLKVLWTDFQVCAQPKN